ncbi:MAG: hypothetical protein N3B16_12010 [Candidatus Aminicenantes bacterium]|nr:hypothetical protein [Candidatus Aminicenantes bacterium]
MEERKKSFLIIFFSTIFLSFFYQSWSAEWDFVEQQRIQEESIVINVEVPVRVFKGSQFVDDLKLNDFEVTEDGIPQKIEAIYLIRKRSIERREEERVFKPSTTRNFFLVFEINDFMPRLNEALDYFVLEVLRPGDNLFVMTPLKSYRLSAQAMQARPKEKILEQLKGLVRRDALIGAAEYRNLLSEMESLAKSLAQLVSGQATLPPGSPTAPLMIMDDLDSAGEQPRSFDEQLQRYVELLGRLDNMRKADEANFLAFADFLKNMTGQKYIFLFYQREYLPKIDPKILYQYIEMYQDRPDISQTITGIIEFYRRDMNLDTEKIRQAFCDSSISAHFMFITTSRKDLAGVRSDEQVDDIFSAFNEIARASGGFVDSSSNPASLLMRAVEASETYYLLYYTPTNKERDGRFREIQVKVNIPGVRVVHRQGYFAR